MPASYIWLALVGACSPAGSESGGPVDSGDVGCPGGGDRGPGPHECEHGASIGWVVAAISTDDGECSVGLAETEREWAELTVGGLVAYRVGADGTWGSHLTCIGTETSTCAGSENGWQYTIEDHVLSGSYGRGIGSVSADSGSGGGSCGMRVGVSVLVEDGGRTGRFSLSVAPEYSGEVCDSLQGTGALLGPTGCVAVIEAELDFLELF